MELKDETVEKLIACIDSLKDQIRETKSEINGLKVEIVTLRKEIVGKTTKATKKQQKG
jgi:hypothetical protein